MLALSHPALGLDTLTLLDKPLFVGITLREHIGVVSLLRPRMEDEENTRFLAVLALIGEPPVDGERACRMYGFQRGGGQKLLNQTGKFELVMRITDWRPTLTALWSTSLT